jgi:aminoglycoside phosphotransferase (APT) family kinase protein
MSTMIRNGRRIAAVVDTTGSGVGDLAMDCDF